MLNLFDRHSYFLLLLLLTVMAALSFQKNYFGFADRRFLLDFQTDSEALVLGGIVADDYALDKHGANLGFIAKDRVVKSPETIPDAYAFFLGQTAHNTLDFTPYKSNYGIQEVLFSQIHRLFRANRLSQLQRVNSVLLAVIVVSLFSLYRRIYDNRFAVIFLITMISSPWIVAFARNLYWVPFLWFLPALLAAMAYLKKGVAIRSLLLLAVAASVCVKSLAGYEYLSTITLFACSVFVVAPFFRSSNRDWPGNLRMFVLVFVACVSGFVGALLVHATMRGDSILAGLSNILEQDVKRRTYGDPAEFPELLKESLECSPLSVVETYVFAWRPPAWLSAQKDYGLLAWLPGGLFTALLAFGIFGICYKVATKHATLKRDAVLFAFFFVVPVSWLVLAKAHSCIHVHINYVLWYFGFVQALIYVAFNTVSLLSIAFVKWAKTVTTGDF
jgi:hypothetical protein